MGHYVETEDQFMERYMGSVIGGSKVTKEATLQAYEAAKSLIQPSDTETDRFALARAFMAAHELFVKEDPNEFENAVREATGRPNHRRV